MDKYRRNDDANDDLGVYRQESYPNMTYSRFKHQELNTIGPHDETEISYGNRLLKLSRRETELLNLINKGLSIRRSARRMKIKQQTASVYWHRIKEKLK